MDVTVELLEDLATKAIENGTEKQWIAIALDWMKAANARIIELQKEGLNEEIRTNNQKSLPK